MERKRNQILLSQVCLLLWIGISVSVAQDGDTAAGNSAVANTAQPEATTPTVQTQSQESTVHTVPETNCLVYTCMGEGCYNNKSLHANPANTTCPNHCALYRQNSSFYESKCDEHCNHHRCNNTVTDGCTTLCCNSMGCNDDGKLQNATSSTMIMSTAAPTMPMTTSATIVYSDKLCRSFKCDGMDCYKNQAAAAKSKPCQVGINHCELQKIMRNGVPSYEGGCSNTCSSSPKSCAAITTGNCFQECCNATKAACCMILDGQVRFNTAPLVRKGSILKIFTCAALVMFISRFISSSFA